MTEPSVLFDTLSAGDATIGVATLNAPKRLNALTWPMIKLLHPQLETWKNDTSIAAVVLRGAGERAFCAGGDIRAITEAQGNGADLSAAAGFFGDEYGLMHRLHTFPNPLIALGNGIVMGGGMGLLQAASHRVVSDDSMLAMPEITIGLFLDVGSAWFMQRTPGKIGLFAGLTAFRFNAADAMHCGLADYRISAIKADQLLSKLATLVFTGDAAVDHDRVSGLLRRFHEPSRRPDLLDRLEAINAAMDARQPLALRQGRQGAGKAGCLV